MSTQISKDTILNLATNAATGSASLSATIRQLFETGTDNLTLAPLTDAMALANKAQEAVIKSTVSRVSKDVTGTRWGFKDGILRPTENTGAGRPAATTEDKLRKFIAANGWKATLSALYAVAQADAEAARELLAVVEVLNPTAK